MGLEQQLNNDLIAAMKAGDKARVSTLRLIRSRAKNTAIEKGDTLSDDDFLTIIQKEAKRRKESLAMYEKGGRDDLVQQEKLELEILSTYLPKSLSESEMALVIDQVIEDVGATQRSDMGRVMGKVMAMVQGRADGKLIQNMVQEKLGS